MEPQLQHTVQSDSVYRELDKIDQALHRLKQRLVFSHTGENRRAEVLLKTGGILQKKHTKKNILSWQRKIRKEWKA